MPKPPLLMQREVVGKPHIIDTVQVNAQWGIITALIETWECMYLHNENEEIQLVDMEMENYHATLSKPTWSCIAHKNKWGLGLHRTWLQINWVRAKAEDAETQQDSHQDNKQCVVVSCNQVKTETSHTNLMNLEYIEQGIYACKGHDNAIDAPQRRGAKNRIKRYCKLKERWTKRVQTLQWRRQVRMPYAAPIHLKGWIYAGHAAEPVPSGLCRGKGICKLITGCNWCGPREESVMWEQWQNRD